MNLREEQNLEKRFFRYATFYTGLLASISFFENIIFNLGSSLVIFSVLFVILSFTCFYFSKKEAFYNIYRNIFFVGLIILLDISYFLSGGLDSSITYIFIMAFLIINLIIKRNKFEQILFYFIFTTNILFIFYLEQLYPSWVTPYSSLNAKNGDLIGSFSMVLLLISIIINFFKTTYENFLKNIDDKNKDLILSEKKANEERDKAERANNAKKEFLSVMSHEIRTPLNAIISSVNLLEKKEDKIDEELIKILKDASENLLALVSDILDFSKIESGKIKLEEKDFNLKELVERVVNVYSTQSKKRNNKLTLIIDSLNHEYFIGDYLRISQILNNLISNAIKFTENGNIYVRVKCIREEDEIYYILFEVEDTGIGISEDKIDYIFEEFTQENYSITRKYGGSGLGLSITKNLILLMNSNINVDSKLGIGSKFYFCLNFKKANIIENSQPSITTNDISKIKILLVEDNDINIKLTSKILDNWNVKYKVAKNGLIALKTLENEKFDTILMDLQMPEMDGFTATQKIREFDDKTPIIAVTANSMAEEREKCLSLGFNEYITKPFKQDNLKEKIVLHYNKNVII